MKRRAAYLGTSAGTVFLDRPPSLLQKMLAAQAARAPGAEKK